MLELEVVKKHCRIEPDFTDDDSLLTLYIGAASRYVETWTRRKMYESETSEGYADDPDSILPGDDVKAAMLLLIGHWYEHRETVVVGQTAIEAHLPLSLFYNHTEYMDCRGKYGL
ncbi:uncharacterized phage protein (possible DNA packaging) [Klebsiella pneumoniae]|nr:uncharacterized phage protein (possible DNA packaging) [Klebsiella pneumoniae]